MIVGKMVGYFPLTARSWFIKLMLYAPSPAKARIYGGDRPRQEFILGPCSADPWAG